MKITVVPNGSSGKKLLVTDDGQVKASIPLQETGLPGLYSAKEAKQAAMIDGSTVDYVLLTAEGDVVLLNELDQRHSKIEVVAI